MADNFVTNVGSGGSTFASDDVGGIQYPRAKSVWGVDGSAADTSLLNGLPIQPVATNFIFSALGQNTTVTQLAAAATFTGTIESTSSQQCISILLTVDQPGTLVIEQFIDASGVFKSNSWTYSVASGVPFSRNFTANGNYARVKFTNNGASTTTTLNLNTAFGTLPAVDDLGNAQMSLNEVNGTAISLGQTTMVASLPVVLASNQTAVPVSSPMALSSYNVAGVITINTVLLTIDCLNAQAVSVQCIAMGTTGVVTPSWSNDNTTFVNATSLLTQAGVPITTISAAGLWTTHVLGRYLKLTLTTATTAGTTTFSVQAIAESVGAVQAQPVIQTLGTAATRYFAQISDGTNSPAVKAASTAAAFTDPSQVVSVRPGEALVGASAALADALTNPTLGQQAVLTSVFNGTTWDRTRGMSGNLTTGDTGAKTATGNGATIANVGNKGVQVVVSMGTVSGTTPTCVLKMQGSADGGTTWYDIPGATTASLVATGVWGITCYPGIAVTAGTTTTGSTASANMPVPRAWRMVWTIGGTTPSFTITNIQYNYLPN